MRVAGATQTSLTSPLFQAGFLAGNPHPHLGRLREEAPVALDPALRVWILSGYPEVMAASRDPKTFRSGKGILLSELGAEYSEPPTLMHTDPPAHGRYRKLLEPAFSPEALAALEPRVRSRAEALIYRLPLDRPLELVSQLALPLPLQVLADALGIPEADWTRFREWSEAAVPDASDLPEARIQELMIQMMAYLLSLVAMRRAAPADDLISQLTEVESDGDRLDDTELALFVVQLLQAGNETVRHSLSGGLVALAEHPQEWQRLRYDPRLLPQAVEELLRWTSPVVYHLRTTTRSLKLGGRSIPQDAPVMLLYLSANRDVLEFGATAGRLDIGRRPNNHLAFGFGPHACLGADLARLQLRAVLETLLRRVGHLEISGPIERSGSLALSGFRKATLTFRGIRSG